MKNGSIWKRSGFRQNAIPRDIKISRSYCVQAPGDFSNSAVGLPVGVFASASRKFSTAAHVNRIV